MGQLSLLTEEEGGGGGATDMQQKRSIALGALFLWALLITAGQLPKLH